MDFTKIVAEQWQCCHCGKYFFVHKGAGKLFGIRCPFFCVVASGGIGKYVRDVKIIL